MRRWVRLPQCALPRRRPSALFLHLGVGRSTNAGSVDTPKAFLEAISKTRRNLAENSTCVSALGEDWDAMFRLTSEKLKGEGVSPQHRKYILWSLEKFRQGEDPKEFAYDTKKKKKVRGWGPRVQKGIRVRGMLRPGERRA